MAVDGTEVVSPATRALAAALGLAGTTALLLALAPPTSLVGQVQAGLTARDDGTGLLTAVLASAAWALLLWIATAVAATVAARMPGLGGRLGGAVAQRISPGVVRRVVGGSAAVGLALGPVLVPVAASAGGRACAPFATTTTALPSLDRPLAPPCPAGPAPAARPVAVPSPPGPAATARSHRVVPGDTLWGLARTELRAAGAPTTVAAVAARWPAWWRANRAEIGPDPGLLRPGTALHPPSTPPAWSRLAPPPVRPPRIHRGVT